MILKHMLNQSAALDLMFQALADPSRRVMVERLTRGPASVSELAKPLAMSLPAVVQHLQVLEASGLVRSEKRGRIRICRIKPEALSMADRVAIMVGGRVVQSGGPEALYRRPKNRFVAAFLGETNFIRARVDAIVEGDPPTASLRTDAGTLEALLDGARPARGDAVTLSIRPESFRLRPLKEAGAESCGPELVGRRRHTTYLGEIAQHEVELGGDVRVRVSELNPAHVRRDDATCETDAPVALAVAASDVVVLR